MLKISLPLRLIKIIHLLENKGDQIILLGDINGYILSRKSARSRKNWASEKSSLINMDLQDQQPRDPIKKGRLLTVYGEL